MHSLTHGAPLSEDDAITRQVEAIVRSHLLRLELPGEIAGDLSLLKHGAGLDSIAVVEVLFDCEKAFDISISHDLFNETDITMNDVVRVVRDAVHSRAVSAS